MIQTILNEINFLINDNAKTFHVFIRHELLKKKNKNTKKKINFYITVIHLKIYLFIAMHKCDKHFLCKYIFLSI